MSGDVMAAGPVVLGTAGVLCVAEIWSRKLAPKPENVRKLAHVGAALFACLLPFVVHHHLTVLGIAITSLAGIFLARRAGILTGLDRVERPSFGVELFPVAVWITYLLAGEQSWQFCAALLVLGFSDSAAALVGERFGRHRYHLLGGDKTLEGTLAFLATAIPILWISVILTSGAGILAALGAATLAAAAAALAEALTPRGLDNLTIPVTVVLALPALLEGALS